MEPPPVNHVRTTKLRQLLSHWGPWMVVAYMGLVAITVTGFVVNGKTVKQAAVTKAQQDRCLASRPVLRKVSKGFAGVKDLSNILVLNSKAVLDNTRQSDPDYLVRLANLQRIERARAKVVKLPDFPVPTIAQCRSG